MENLMNVIKEANIELKTILGDRDKLLDEISSDDEKLKNIIFQCGELVIKYQKRVKEQVTLDYFAQLMILDMHYDFIGGGIIKDKGDTVIKID